MSRKDKENRDEQENINANKNKGKKDKDRKKKILLYIIIGILTAVLIGTIAFAIVKDNKDEDTIKEDEIAYTELINS